VTRSVGKVALVAATHVGSACDTRLWCSIRKLRGLHHGCGMITPEPNPVHMRPDSNEELTPVASNFN
jgi:hypothetical protein